jgi:hypothetical protein
MDSDIRIEASNEALVELKAVLYDAIDTLDLQEDTESQQGEHGEAILVSLVIALGGAKLTQEIFKTVRHWLTQREAMKKIEIVKFYLEQGDNSKEVAFSELTEWAKAGSN